MVSARSRIAATALTLVLACLPVTSHGLVFRESNTGIEGLLDIELAYGLRMRTENTDPDLVSLAHGGERINSGDYDDGTLNYDRGDLVSNMFRTTGELTLRWGDFGAYVRGYGYYDYENMDSDRQRTPLSADAEEQVGSGGELLDAHVTARFTLKDVPLMLRLGDQVVNWGESRFFAVSGLNVANPVDIPRFQQPTSTPRDLRRPVGMLWGAAHLTPLLILEGYYQYQWRKTVLPASGTYWSNNDGLSPGGRFIQVTGTASQFGTNLSELYGIPADTLEAAGIPAFDPDYLQVNRRISADRPGSEGQYGLTLQSIVPQLSETKFALHFANYHSKLPFFGAIAPSVEAYKGYSVQAIQALAGNLVEAGADPTLAGPAAALTQLDQFQSDTQYFLQYPEDIKMLGLSLNTTSSRTGTAYFAEVGHHFDAPMPVHVGDILVQALPGSSREMPIPPIDLTQISEEELASNYAEKRVDPILERDKTFSLVGATQFLGPRLGAAATVMNLELAWLHVWNMPNKSERLFSAPGLVITEFGPRNAFASANSWGYRFGFSLAYPNVFGGLNLRPRILWSHDVDGNSPVGVGPFREGRKTFSFGIQAEYIKRLRADLAFTTFWGAGKWNLINDRDNINLSIRYSF